MPVEVACIPALADNYIWLLHDPESGDTVVVDPGEAPPVLAEADRRGWRIRQIWNTHWHADHTGGNAAIKAATGCIVSGPAAEAARIPALDRQLAEGDRVSLGALVATVLETPGHTSGHVAFHFAEAGMIFVGDTLFAMGSGRLFEGAPAEMWANMQRLAALPAETIVYPAHEYTQANGRFARVAEPDNAAIEARMAQVDAARTRGEATVPTTIAEELATNPFLRAGSVEAFARLRQAKDVFRG